MKRLQHLYKKSFCLSEETDKEFFDCVRDYYYTQEFQSLDKSIQHGSITLIQHIKSVAYLSYRISKKLNLDFCKTARGALLHDLFYYDWHDPDPSHRLHGYFHPGFALKNARELSAKNNLELSEIEENIIYRHMFPLTVIPPKYKESLLVCLVDKYVATKEIIICSSEKRSKKFFGEIKESK
ncbi:MAG: HD domain-containing protein [Clostridia bacterium]|nr:HD domain-containing protein [Clostridia bacterium]